MVDDNARQGAYLCHVQTCGLSENCSRVSVRMMMGFGTPPPKSLFVRKLDILGLLYLVYIE